MGADPYKKVQPGQPFRMSASAYNAFVDAAVDFRQRSLGQGGAGARGAGDRSGIGLVRNDSGSDVDQFGVLTLAGIVVAPADNEPSFRSGPVFSAVTPVAGKPVAILQEPIKNGKFGKAMIAGVTPAKMSTAAGSLRFADIIPSTAATLAPAATGPARILWCAETATEGGGYWAAVCLNQAPPMTSDHPWKLFVRPVTDESGEVTGWEYTVAVALSSAIAGVVFTPNNQEFFVFKPAWAPISESKSIHLKLTVTQESMDYAFEEKAYGAYTPTNDINASPGILGFHVGSILVENNVATIAENELDGHIMLTGAMIPAWYANYSKASKQYLWHDSGGAPAWQTTTDDFACPESP